jgi:hypothetical protein
MDTETHLLSSQSSADGTGLLGAEILGDVLLASELLTELRVQKNKVKEYITRPGKTIWKPTLALVVWL